MLDIFSLLTHFSDRCYSLKHRNLTVSIFLLKIFQWHDVCGPIHGHQRRPAQPPHLCFCSNYSELLVLLHIQPSNHAVAHVQSLLPCFWNVLPFLCSGCNTQETHTLYTSSHLTSVSNLTTNWSTTVYIFYKS